MTKTSMLDLIRVRALAESGEAHRLREKARLSLSEMASACEVDQSSIWRWETQRRRPRGPAAIRYARVLELLNNLEANR